MLTITDPYSTPSGGWWSVRNAEDGATIQAAIPVLLWQLWAKHRRENGQPVMSFDEMQDAFCRQLPADCPTCGAAAINPYNYPDLAEWRKLDPWSRDVWGPPGWTCLHRHQITGDPHEDERWLMAFRESIPCNMAPRLCRQHFAEYMVKNPPDFSSQDAFFVWAWQAHQETNSRTGKVGISLEMAREIYKNHL